MHWDCVGITDCVGLLTWEMKDVVSAVIELDCVPGHAVGLDDCMHCGIEKGAQDCFRIGIAGLDPPVRRAVAAIDLQSVQF